VKLDSTQSFMKVSFNDSDSESSSDESEVGCNSFEANLHVCLSIDHYLLRRNQAVQT